MAHGGLCEGQEGVYARVSILEPLKMRSAVCASQGAPQDFCLIHFKDQQEV